MSVCRRCEVSLWQVREGSLFSSSWWDHTVLGSSQEDVVSGVIREELRAIPRCWAQMGLLRCLLTGPLKECKLGYLTGVWGLPAYSVLLGWWRVRCLSLVGHRGCPLLCQDQPSSLSTWLSLALGSLLACPSVEMKMPTEEAYTREDEGLAEAGQFTATRSRLGLA